MITVKAPQAAAPPSAPTRETFEHVEKPMSWRWPAAIAGLVSVVALYLKSLGGSSAIASPPAPETPPQPREEAEAPVAPPTRASLTEDELTQAVEEPLPSDQQAELMPAPLHQPGGGNPDRLVGSSVSVTSDPPDNVVRLPTRTSSSSAPSDPASPGLFSGPPRVSIAADTLFIPSMGGGTGSGGGSSAGGSGGSGGSDGTGDGDGSPGDGGGSTGGTGGGLPPRNRAPVALGAVRLPDAVACHTTFIAFGVLLAGVFDPDGDALAVVGASASAGTLERAEDGFIYRPDEDMRGPVVITIRISDGETEIVRLARFEVVSAPPIVGTPEDDVIAGTPCDDVIFGLDGDDNIDGRGGDDIIHGGEGADHIVAGAGNDVVFAGAGNDLVFAGEGNDVVFGGAGDDRIHGEAGDDTLMGEDGRDLVTGGDGDDVVHGGDGDDQVQGDAGNDIVLGEAGNDLVLGGDGADTLDGGAGTDQVDGGAGDDAVAGSLDGVADAYAGGEGHDTLDYSHATDAVVIDLPAGEARGAEIGEDSISGFETFVAGSGGDTFIVGNEEARLVGGAGEDEFRFETLVDAMSDQRLVHQILDLEVGDRIVMRNYQIRTSDDDPDSNRGPGNNNERGPGASFDARYGDDATPDQRPFRFRIERIEDKDHTFIDVRDEADQDTILFTVDVHGVHRLYAVEIS